jgi:uncharacterized membrane protein YphA (DoxX/SURF4 family)
MKGLGRLLQSIWLYRTVRAVLGAVFIAAGATKLTETRAFALTIDAFGLAPDPLIAPLAVMLPVVEILAGAGLIADVRGSLGVIALLNAMFIFVLGWGIRLGLDIDCGCYGPGDPVGEALHGLRNALYRDLALMTGVVYAYWWRRENKPVLIRIRS